MLSMYEVNFLLFFGRAQGLTDGLINMERARRASAAAAHAAVESPVTAAGPSRRTGRSSRREAYSRVPVTAWRLTGSRSRGASQREFRRYPVSVRIG